MCKWKLFHWLFPTHSLTYSNLIKFSILGASALPSVKKAASGLDPPPTILATGQNNNRKKLQLQFSFQEKSVSDDEENDDEIGSFAFISQN